MQQAYDLWHAEQRLQGELAKIELQQWWALTPNQGMEPMRYRARLMPGVLKANSHRGHAACCAVRSNRQMRCGVAGMGMSVMP